MYEQSPADPEDVRTWDWWEPTVPHVLTLDAHAMRNGTATKDLGQLLNQTGIHLIQRAELQPATRLLDHALTINEAAYGSDHPQVASTLGNLAIAHRQLGDPTRAADELQRALTIFETAYGPDHPHARHARRLLEPD